MGLPEILIIIVVIALIFGAKRLPELMKGMGQGVREFRNEVKDTPRVGDVVDVPSQRLSDVRVDPVTGATSVAEPVQTERR